MVEDSDSLSSETLDSSRLLQNPDNQSPITGTSSSSSSDTTSLSSSSSDLQLSRNVSFSRLNAQAPEFVPRSSSSSPSPSPSSSSSQSQSSSSSSSIITQPPPPPRVVIPPPPPPGLLHVYQSAAAPPNSPFHVPIHPHHHHVPVQYHHPPHHQQFHRQYFAGGGGGLGDHQEVAVQAAQQQSPVEHDHVAQRKEESNQKLLNQVEYYFSDVNLATTDHLMRFINKDPEGYVPISVVASFKKIKALISSNSHLATILRSSVKLVVSEDGKKVKRQHPLTESDMEDLQSRIIVAENLPEDHCHQNLMKIFSAVGSVKTIRTCPPQMTNGGSSSASRSKAEGMLFSNKLHAFVEYETVELAEKAVADLNDEGNWRSGLRVRLLLRRTAKASQGRGKKAGHEDEVNCEEDETTTSSEPQQAIEKILEDPSQQSGAESHDHIGQGQGEEQVNDKEGGQKKGRNRGRGGGKGRGRPQYNNNQYSQHHQHHNHRSGGNHHHHHHVGTPPHSSSNPSSANTEHPTIVAKQPPGPRMPDGTRGFSMGRGKPLAINIRE